MKISKMVISECFKTVLIDGKIVGAYKAFEDGKVNFFILKEFNDNAYDVVSIIDIDESVCEQDLIQAVGWHLMGMLSKGELWIKS